MARVRVSAIDSRCGRAWSMAISWFSVATGLFASRKAKVLAKLIDRVPQDNQLAGMGLPTQTLARRIGLQEVRLALHLAGRSLERRKLLPHALRVVRKRGHRKGDGKQHSKYG